MSEPTGGERNPFADIIDLFREIEAANEPSPADAEAVPDASTPEAGAETAPAPEAEAAVTAAPAPGTQMLAVQPPRGGTPIAPKDAAPAPSRRRRAVLLLPVALLALAGTATAAVIHHHAGPGTPAAAGGSVTPTPASTMPTTAAPEAPAPDLRTAAYSSALDGLAAASGPKQLTTAAAALPATITRLRAAGGVLPRAEAAHLDSLLALCRLDTSDRLTDYPSLASAATAAAARVDRAGAGRGDVPDTSLATHNVVTTTAGIVATRLDARVARLASSAAHASLTAQLRSVAAQATALAPTATSVGEALAGDDVARATADASALHALGSLSVIDGDHLDAWAALSAPLQQALAAAGVSSATTDVHAIDTMIDSAQQKMSAWAATAQAPGGAGAGGSGSTGKDAAEHTDPAAAQAAKQAEAAIDSYVSSASALLDQYGRTIGGLPVVGPGQEPSAALTHRFVSSAGSLASLSNAVGRLDPPAGMSRAQQALAALVNKAHAAAAAGQAVASSAQSCDSATRSCAYGTQRRWSDYAYDVGALGDAGAVRNTLTSCASTARRAAAAKASAPPPTDGSGTSSGTGSGTGDNNAQRPPKPVV